MRIVTFGEVMLRLAPSGNYRLRQVLPGALDATFGGGELNVAVSVALQGGRSAFLTSVPDNVVTDALAQELGKLGVDADLVQRQQQGRFGIYFVETGANQRGGTVTYDREGASITNCGPEAYDWDRVFQDAGWFHITGITPALCEKTAQAALESVRQAKQRGVTVSCDLNFRKKLWRWKSGVKPVDLARETMRSMMPYIDVVIANEEDADLSLGIAAKETDVAGGHLHIEGFGDVARTIVQQFPNVSRVAITLRESISASHNNWGALLYDARLDRHWLAPLGADGRYEPYEIRNIVDRVGAGDSFSGGLIYALTTPELSEPEVALRYAVAASCLKHTIIGDFNYASRAEIEGLMSGGGSGRVQR
ncbi:MAG: sugar kinase [Planctomycetaceae bacterium]|nr:sugar kinase [Planctomycetaceae bacterium]